MWSIYQGRPAGDIPPGRTVDWLLSKLFSASLTNVFLFTQLTVTNWSHRLCRIELVEEDKYYTLRDLIFQCSDRH